MMGSRMYESGWEGKGRGGGSFSGCKERVVEGREVSKWQEGRGLTIKTPFSVWVDILTWRLRRGRKRLEGRARRS